jgi:hypothetical protein
MDDKNSERMILKGGLFSTRTFIIKEYKSIDILNEVNRRFAPFCHGTSPFSADRIEREGLTLRGRKRSSVWEEGLTSKKDRIYFASIPEGLEGCISAVKQSCSWESNRPLKNGIVYVMEEIPDKYADYLTYDEDVLNEYKKPRDFKRTSKRAVIKSLEAIGTFAIKHNIERKYLNRFNIKDFFYYAQDYNDHYAELGTWNNFVEKWILEREGKEALEWAIKNEPELWELEKNVPFPKDQKRITDF